MILAIMFSSLAAVAQNEQRGEGPRQLTEEQIKEMQTRQTERIKKEINLTEDQTEAFDAAYTNYMNIVMASMSEQFKNKDVRPDSSDEAVNTIFNQIDSQIVLLAAKKQLITNLKDTLSAEQLMKLNMMVGNSSMGPGQQRGGFGGPRGNRGNRGGGSNQGGFGGFDQSSDSF